MEQSCGELKERQRQPTAATSPFGTPAPEAPCAKLLPRSPTLDHSARLLIGPGVPKDGPRLAWDCLIIL